MLRELTGIEKRFCVETGCPADLAAGARIDQGRIFRPDPLLIQGDGFSADRSVLSQIQSIEISEDARFGNYIIKLTNAFGLAKATGIGHIIHPGFEFMSDECDVDGVRFSTKPAPARRRIVNPCFYHQTLQTLTRGAVDKTSIMRTLASGITLSRPYTSGLPDDHLVIHIRSGDIFTQSPSHPYYAQPPLAFYQQVLDHRLWSGVTLVFEDDGNPVIEQLKRHLNQVGLPLIEQKGSLREDLETLFKARNLVIARGTFTHPVVAMSRVIQQVFGFEHYQIDDTERRLRAQAVAGVKFFTVVDLEGSYRDLVLANWQNSSEQLQMMLDYPVSALGMDPETA